MMFLGGFKGVEYLVVEMIQNLRNPGFEAGRHPAAQRKAITPGAHGPEGMQAADFVGGPEPQALQRWAGFMAQAVHFF